MVLHDWHSVPSSGTSTEGRTGRVRKKEKTRRRLTEGANNELSSGKQGYHRKSTQTTFSCSENRGKNIIMLSTGKRGMRKRIGGLSSSFRNEMVLRELHRAAEQVRKNCRLGKFEDCGDGAVDTHADFLVVVYPAW